MQLVAGEIEKQVGYLLCMSSEQGLSSEYWQVQNKKFAARGCLKFIFKILNVQCFQEDCISFISFYFMFGTCTEVFRTHSRWDSGNI